MYTIEKINLDDIKINDKIKYNSNNHWISNKKPDDYDMVSDFTYTSKWINKFRKSYIVINFDDFDLKLLKSMYLTCLVKNEISKIYEDEIDMLVEKYKYVDDYLKLNNGCFIRSENVSLKYGKHGLIPYKSIYDIFESMLTSPIGHSPIYEKNIELRLFIIPWVEINKFQEFRVFVCNNKITAISQQSLYDSNILLKDDDEKSNNIIIKKWCDIVISFFEKTIKHKIKHMDNYSYDFAIIDKNIPYFIEMNPFGKEYSSGSSLFHWLIDEDKLYGKTDDIYFRYVC
jgi:hypothetical protein